VTPPPAAERPFDPEKVRKLRHDMANPLAAVLAETQILLLSADQLNPETVASLKQIEALARRMRQILEDLDL
jgi:signal transduction histidine kinase